MARPRQLLRTAALVAVFLCPARGGASSPPDGAWRAPACLPRAVVVRAAKRRGAVREATALTHEGWLAELWVERGGAWAFFATSPHGVSCLILFGPRWIRSVAPGGRKAGRAK